MIAMNRSMHKLLSSINFNISEVMLPVELKNKLDGGFIILQKKVILLSCLFKGDYDDVLDEMWIKKEFKDYTGYEASINNFHLEDYCSEDNIVCLAESMVFLHAFMENWREKFSDTAVVVFSFNKYYLNEEEKLEYPNGDYPCSSTFKFHKKRDNETSLTYIKAGSTEEENGRFLILEISLDMPPLPTPQNLLDYMLKEAVFSYGIT